MTSTFQFARLLVLVLCLLAWPGFAVGQYKAPDAPCESHCLVIERMNLEGDLNAPPLRFVLEGHVVSREPQPVPLFGPPASVRIDGVTLAGRKAIVGFDSDSYFVRVGHGSFQLKGTLVPPTDVALHIPGPVNAFDASIANGRIVEGTSLSGISKLNLHFEFIAAASPLAGEPSDSPAVLQLSRALRIGKETQFEYRIEVSSSSNIGMVELPLRFGERVLEVT